MIVKQYKGVVQWKVFECNFYTLDHGQVKYDNPGLVRLFCGCLVDGGTAEDAETRIRKTRDSSTTLSRIWSSSVNSNPVKFNIV